MKTHKELRMGHVVSHAVAEESVDVGMQRANGDGGGDSGRGDSSLQASNNPNVPQNTRDGVAPRSHDNMIQLLLSLTAKLRKLQ